MSRPVSPVWRFHPYPPSTIPSLPPPPQYTIAREIHLSNSPFGPLSTGENRARLAETRTTGRERGRAESTISSRLPERLTHLVERAPLSSNGLMFQEPFFSSEIHRRQDYVRGG